MTSLVTRLSCLVLVLTLAACAGGTGRLDLDRFRGVYTTHFDGIPDRAAVCAVVSNRGTTPIDWLRLKLESVSHLGGQPGRWVSKWTYEGRLEPGQSVALELRDPPVTEQIQLDVASSGRGTPPAGGRPAHRAEQCSERALLARLEREAGGRTAPGREGLTVVRRNDGVRDDDVLVALETEGEEAPNDAAR
jgi:hypothetical protein